MLYAPDPVASGSSISHWDQSASPDLLMEHQLSPSIFDDVDMTPDLFRDLGHTIVGDEVIFTDGFNAGDTNSWSDVVP
jgi:hypothetical protein